MFASNRVSLALVFLAFLGAEAKASDLTVDLPIGKEQPAFVCSKGEPSVHVGPAKVFADELRDRGGEVEFALITSPTGYSAHVSSANEAGKIVLEEFKSLPVARISYSCADQSTAPAGSITRTEVAHVAEMCQMMAQYAKKMQFPQRINEKIRDEDPVKLILLDMVVFFDLTYKGFGCGK